MHKLREGKIFVICIKIDRDDNHAQVMLASLSPPGSKPK